MRTASGPELARLAAAAVNHYVKVEVKNASGTWKDLTNLSGVDWVDSWEIDGEKIDIQVATAKISLRRDTAAGAKSLAPIVIGSPLNVNDAATYAPLLDLGRAVRITTAVTAAGVAPVSGDWKEMFLGRINAIAWEASPVVVQCSDLFAWVVDRFIEADDPAVDARAGLGSDSGASIESILQALLHDWPPLPGEPTLYTPVSPGWIIPKAFNSTKKALSEMMKDLVDQIAWELRYRYDASGVSRLTFFEPPRTKAVSDATVSPAMYRAVTKLSLAIDDIRNAVRVNYLNGTGSAANTISVDAPSEAKYGRRYMEIPGGANITASTEAQVLGDAAVSDLSEPFAEQDVELLYYWPAQLYDLLTFPANGDHYDVDVQLAVIGVKHAGANGEIITTLTCRGSVAGAYANWLKRARGANPTATGTPETSILGVSETESTDGTERIFTVTIGALVDTVHVHFRTVPIDEAGDAFDFSGDEDIAESPTLIILRRPTDGTDTVTFSMPHPVRDFKVAGRLVPRVGPPTFAEGASWLFAVDAAPPAVNAKLHPSKVGALGSLSIDVAFGVSDGPVTVDVIEDALTTSTTILTLTMTVGATLDSGSHAELGNRALPPGKDSLSWRVRITDVSGQPYWFGPATVNRDPLPTGTPTVENYRADPAIICPFDPDTDQIRYTSHGGKTKTFNAAALLAAGSPVTYTVGDAFDDATTEAALAVDEVRSGSLVEYQGGSQWVTMWSGDLHGTPSNPPTAKVRVVKAADGSTEDGYVLVDSSVLELLRVYYRDSEGSGAPVYGLVTGAGDATPLYVAAGTEIGPAYFFKNIDGSGPITTKLAAIALTRDQIKRSAVQVEGEDSLVRSSWTPLVFSLLEQPWSESLELLFDQSTRKIRAVLVAGAHTLSAFFEFADNESFTSPTTSSGNVADGSTLIKEVTLSAAQLGKPWWVRVTPYNAVSEGGLAGVPQKASVAVPAAYTVDGTPTEAAGAGTVTLVVADPGSLFDQTHTDGAITSAISWHVTRAGVYTAPEASTAVPGAGATTGTWTKVITLDPQHNITVVAIGHFIDGSSRVLGTWTFDSNKISDLASSGVADNGATATVTLNWDTDTLVGANCARYSLDAGATWTWTVTVSSALVSTFNVTRLSSNQAVLVQAKSAIDSTWGNQATVAISAYVSDGPTLTVTPTPGSSSYSIAYTGTGTITLSIDGGSYGSPASSPITVTRTTSDHVYAFQAVQAGQTVTDSVTIPALGTAGTVTADLTVTPGTPAATTQPYTVTASNPSGGAAPTIVMTLTGASATSPGPVTYADGSTTTIASGIVITVNRPASTVTTQAHVKFRATISGGGSEEVDRTVPAQLNVGPSLTVTPTPGPSSYSIAYTGTGTITLSIDGGSYGSPASSPITVTRDTSDHVYAFKAVADGQTITADTTIPALGGGAGTGQYLSLTLWGDNPGSWPNDGGGNFYVHWVPSAGLSLAGCTFNIAWYVVSGQYSSAHGPYTQTGIANNDSISTALASNPVINCTVTALLDGLIIATGTASSILAYPFPY